MKISVLLPAFNEETTIEHVLERLNDLPFSEFEAIVVDDGSSDRSASVVSQA